MVDSSEEVDNIDLLEKKVRVLSKRVSDVQANVDENMGRASAQIQSFS